MQTKYDAFVISPIGLPGSPERAHADWVLRELIQRACERVACDAYAVRAERSESAKQPGDIMEQVVESLINDQVVFAVLAFDRPNVYYELALANAAGRQVIMLRDEHEKTHFDIAGLRAISYRHPMDGQALDDKVTEIAEYIRTVISGEKFKPVVFKNNLTPLGRGYREYQFVEKFRDIDVPTYSSYFTEAKEFIGLQGMTLRHFARQDFDWFTPAGKVVSFFDIIRSKVLFDAVNVDIVMMHPDNPALPHLIKFVDPARFAQAVGTVRNEIAESFDEWSALKTELDGRAPEREDKRKGELRIIQLAHGVVNYRLTVTDQRAIVSPYMNIFPFNGLGPTIVCVSETGFHDRIKREFFDRIVSNNLALAARGAQRETG